MKVEATEVDGRKVFSVRAFNQGIASWLERLPTVWVEGEVTELRRQERWASVFLTLKDPESGATLPVQMQRTGFDALRLDLVDGERVRVFGRPELYEQRGDFHRWRDFGPDVVCARSDRGGPSIRLDRGDGVGDEPLCVCAMWYR